MSIKIKVNGNIQEVDQFTFSGGEVQVRIDPTVDYITDEITIIAKIKSSDDLMALLLTWDAVRYRANAITIMKLELKYFPYARQDRRCQKGEASSMYMACQMVNMMSFDEVVVWDIHNESTLGMLNNVNHKPQHELVSQIIDDYDYLVSPDKGAKPKIEKLSFCPHSVIVGEKITDVSTGEITHTTIHKPDDSLANSKALIVDDICDGGRTFIELAKVLKKEGVSQVDLYVTHGIFSKGFEVFDNLIDNIYTTDSFYSGTNDNVIVLNLEDK